MKNLSKSKLVAYDQCAKRLWLEVHKPQESVLSAQTLAVFATGKQVGAMAQQLYDINGNGTLIEPFVEGWPSAFRRTRELVQGDKPIFEATLSGRGVLALADVLLPADDGSWNMIEVKSSTSVKDYHYLDVSVQTFAALAAGLKLNRVALACIDSSWVYPGGSDYRGLLYETDFTAAAFDSQDHVASLVSAAQAVANSSQEPEIAIGPHCSEPFECGFYSYCTRDLTLPDYPISWLPNQRQNELKEFIAHHNVVDMTQVPDALLNEQQLRVKTATLSGQPYFDANATRLALSTGDLSGGWPAYFIDFETINFAVPLWAGTRPYQQVPYQFSNHVISATGDVKHHQYLDLSGDDPRRGFAQKLIDTCGQAGPVYVYNLGFEKSVIAQLAELFDDLAQPLNAIIARLVDLLPVARDYYYHPAQQGSWSIKKLLPTIAPAFDYAALDGVQDGGMAIQVFAEAVDAATTAGRKAEIEQQLLKYCELDTWAMVLIWRFFRGEPLL